jgi:drug/metabolite transporter (DMT)-like permease
MRDVPVGADHRALIVGAVAPELLGFLYGPSFRMASTSFSILAWMLLGENLNGIRWAGIAIIIIGVMLVGASSEADARVAPGDSSAVSHTVFESHQEGDPIDKTG